MGRTILLQQEDPGFEFQMGFFLCLTGFPMDASISYNR